MIGYSILKSLFDAILIQDLGIKNIYHSVQLVPLPDGGHKPTAPVNGRFTYVGVDDTKGFSAYCRQLGSMEVREVEKVGSCNRNIYTFNVPHRMVFYNDNEKRDHSQVLAKLMKAVIGSVNVKISRVSMSPEEILRSEAPTAKASFRDRTFYASIDFSVLLKLQADTCETEMTCDKIENPYC